jgi:hypothetical protein
MTVILCAKRGIWLTKEDGTTIEFVATIQTNQLSMLNQTKGMSPEDSNAGGDGTQLPWVMGGSGRHRLGWTGLQGRVGWTTQMRQHMVEKEIV